MRVIIEALADFRKTRMRIKAVQCRRARIPAVVKCSATPEGIHRSPLNGDASERAGDDDSGATAPPVVAAVLAAD